MEALTYLLGNQHDPEFPTEPRLQYYNYAYKVWGQRRKERPNTLWEPTGIRYCWQMAFQWLLSVSLPWRDHDERSVEMEIWLLFDVSDLDDFLLNRFELCPHSVSTSIDLIIFVKTALRVVLSSTQQVSVGQKRAPPKIEGGFRVEISRTRGCLGVGKSQRCHGVLHDVRVCGEGRWRRPRPRRTTFVRPTSCRGNRAFGR